MSEPFISFIIPAYNAQKTITTCLQSIIDCDYPLEKKEIIVVNNNSTDLTEKIVADFPVTAIQETRQGRSIARNTGARIAKGEILAFIDADCKISPNWSKEIAKSFKTPQIGATQGPIIPISDGEENFLSRFRFYQSAHLTNDSHILMDVVSFKLPMINSACCAYSKMAFEFVGGFDEELERHEDIDLSRRVFHAGFPVKSSPQAFSEVFWHGEGWSDFYLRSIAHGKTLVDYDKKWKVKSPLTILYHFFVSKFINNFFKINFSKNIFYWSIDNFFTFSSLIAYQFFWFKRNYAKSSKQQVVQAFPIRHITVDQERYLFKNEINFVFLEGKSLIKNLKTGVVIEADQVYHFFLSEIIDGNNHSSRIITSCLKEFAIEHDEAGQYFNDFIKILQVNSMIVPASAHG